MASRQSGDIGISQRALFEFGGQRAARGGENV